MTYHPRVDGQVERLNKSLVKILSKLISDHRRGRSQDKVVRGRWSSNYLKQCFSPPEIQEKPSQLTSASHAEDTPQADNLRDGQSQPYLTLEMSNWNGWKIQLLQSQGFLIPSRSVNLVVHQVHPLNLMTCCVNLSFLK